MAEKKKKRNNKQTKVKTSGNMEKIDSTSTELKKNKIKIDKKKEEISKKNLKIWQKAEKILMGIADPFDIKISKEIEDLSEIRENSVDQDDIYRGIKSYKYLDDVNTKQKEKLESVFSSNLWAYESNLLLEFLDNSSRLNELKKKTIINNIKRGLFPLPLKTDLHFPITISHTHLDQIKTSILEIYSHLELDIALLKEEEEGVEFLKEKVENIERDLFDSEDFDNYQYFMKIYNEIKNKKKIKILKFILTDSFGETLMRLQALSYLVSNNFLILVPSDTESKSESGKYIAIVNENNIEQSNNDDNHSANTYILGINYHEWKSLQPCLKDASKFKTRPLLANID